MFIKKLTLENIKLCSLFFILNIFLSDDNSNGLLYQAKINNIDYYLHKMEVINDKTFN